MEKTMNKTLIISILVFLVSFIIVRFTQDGIFTMGDFTLLVPPEIYSLATWTLGISTTITVPIAIRSWMASRHNILTNAGLQDMKLSHLIEQNDLIMEQTNNMISKDIHVSKADKESYLESITSLLNKSKDLKMTKANFISIDKDQKRSYIRNQISSNELIKRKAEQVGDFKTIKLMNKAIKIGYTQLRKLDV